MGDITPPLLQGPSSKEKKYDRQLRLWAASGQAALEAAHILLVNSGSGAVGVETLKNLVLPGVGRFTVLDPAVVGLDDLGVNFFLDESSVGKSRAQQSCHFLQELNPDVHGEKISETVEACISRDPDFLQAFTLIILTWPIPRSTLQAVGSYANAYRIPLFYLHSVGFYAHFSLALPATFPIVETHPDAPSTVDLRLLDPWPELASLAQKTTKDLDQLGHHEHSHVPYVLLLLHYLDVWRKTHAGKSPQNYQEKSEFRDLVRDGARLDDHGGGISENFEEAIGAVLKSLNPVTVSSAVKEVFAADECEHLTKESASFWVIASAIAVFYRAHSCLPLSGSLPDMKAQSADYIALQNVYRAKARQDYLEVLAHVRQIEKQLDRDEPRQTAEKDVELFCHEAGFVKLIRGRPLHVVRAVAAPGRRFSWGPGAQAAYNELINDPDSLLPIYMGFLAYDAGPSVGGGAGNDSRSRAASEAPRSPPPAPKRLKDVKRSDQASSSEAPHLPAPAEPARLDDVQGSDQALSSTPLFRRALDLLQSLCRENKTDLDALPAKAKDRIVNALRDITQEITRADRSELHNVSALTGGMVAQEIIKVVTKQYVPVDNTVVFDAVRGRSAVWRM